MTSQREVGRLARVAMIVGSGPCGRAPVGRVSERSRSRASTCTDCGTDSGALAASTHGGRSAGVLRLRWFTYAEAFGTPEAWVLLDWSKMKTSRLV